MSIETLHTDNAPKAIGPYAQAVRANGFLFTAGQIPLDPVSMEVVAGDIAAKSAISRRNTVVLTTCIQFAPAASSTAVRFFKTCVV